MIVSRARGLFVRLPELHGTLIGSGVVQLAGMAFTILLGVQLARILGPVNYGVYGVAMAFVSLLGAPAQAGLPVFATREAARAAANGSRTDLRTLFNWFVPRVLFFSLATGCLAFAGTALVNISWLSARWLVLVISAVLLVFLSLSAVFSALLRGVGANILGQSLDLVVKPAATALLVFVVFMTSHTLPVTTALLLQVLATALCVAIAAAIFLARARAQSGRDLKYNPGKWRAVAGAFTANSLLAVLNGNYPVIIAGLFASATDVGVLRVALSASALLALPVSIANIATVPIVARQSAEGDDASVAKTLGHTTLAAAGATIIGLLIVIVFGRSLIGLLFGSAYLGAYTPLIIIGFANLLIACFGIAGSYLNMTGREFIVVKAFCISVPAGLVASVILGKIFGISGVAAGVVIMNATWHFYVFVIHRREVRVPLFIGSAIRLEWGKS